MAALAKRLALSVALAALALGAGVAVQAEDAMSDATRIFEMVCVDGSGSFGANEIRAIDPADVHYRAREVLMTTLWLEEYSVNGHNRVEKDEMPSRVFAVQGEPDIVLLLPDAQPTNPVQAACSVLIKGDHYEELAEYGSMLTATPLPDLRQINSKVSFRMGDHGVAVAKNWTFGATWTLITTAPLASN